MGAIFEPAQVARAGYLRSFRARLNPRSLLTYLLINKTVITPLHKQTTRNWKGQFRSEDMTHVGRQQRDRDRIQGRSKL